MLNIFKKEIKSLFRTGTAFFFVVPFILLASGYSTVYNFSAGYSGIEIILPVLSRAIAILLPILTANIFVSERENGTDKIFLALPFKSSAVVIGKYLALLSVFGAEIIFLAILPIIFGFFGTVNYLASYLSLACFFLFGAAMLALYVFIAAAFKSKLWATVVSYASALVAFLLYLVPTGATQSIWMTAAKTLRFLSPFSHLDNFAIGAVRINSVLYFVAFAALFLFLAIRAEDKKRAILVYGKGTAQTKCGALSPVLAIILSVCTVVVNAGLSFLPVRLSTLDATSNKELTISNATKDFLSTLDCEVTMYVINADGSNKQFELLLELYDEYSSKLTTKYVYQDSVKDKLAAHGWDGSFDISAYTLLIESERDRSLPFHPSDGYYYNHPSFGNMSESQYQQYYQMLSQYAKAYPDNYQAAFDSLVNDTQAFSNTEQKLTMYIEYTALKFIPGAYYLTGHGEPTENSTFYSFMGSSGIEFRGALNLSSATSLPEDASSLVINAPTSDLSAEETALIKSFLANGGSLTLMTNEANLDMPNLMSILANYGVSAKKGAVSFDHKAAYEKAQAEAEAANPSEEPTEDDDNASEEEITFPDNDLVYALANTSHPSISYLKNYSSIQQAVTQVKRANHIEVAGSRASVKVTPLFTTDKECFIEGVENSAGEKTIAVAIEETVGNDTTNIAWYTGASSFDGSDIQMLNAYAAAYSIIWGIDEPTSTLGNIEPKLIGENTLLATKTGSYAFIVIAAVLIPCAFVIAGMLSYRKLKKNPFAPKKKEGEEEAPEVAEESPEDTEDIEDIEDIEDTEDTENTEE